MKLGLVLGAGGATVWVFHTGVLETLRAEWGVDPADADIIVGTSAGATVAAAVRAGVETAEIRRSVTTPPTPEQRAAMLSAIRAARKTVRPLSPRLARHALPSGKGVTFALAGLLPPGWFPTSWLASLPWVDETDRWPEGLWIPSVRATDGEVVVFGRDRVDVPLDLAVQASSAVPGMFLPTVIDGVPFVDGGVASSTHADVLVGADVDVAIISAPMVKPARRLFTRHARRMLRAEVAALEDAGIETIVVQASAETVNAARGFPRRNPGAAPLIAGHAAEAARLALSPA